MMRWLGRGNRVFSMSKIHVPYRRDENGHLTSVTIPDHVDILAKMACGAQARMQFSAVTGLAASISRAWLFGSEGTLCYDLDADQLSGGKRADSDLAPIAIPAELEGDWRVEEEFINAIRGQEKISHTTFEDGLKYMQFTEAVTRSARSGVSVSVQDVG
jgi:predicted dehydrogenase